MVVIIIIHIILFSPYTKSIVACKPGLRSRSPRASHFQWRRSCLQNLAWAGAGAGFLN